MTVETASDIAKKIASGIYNPEEARALMDFLETAERNEAQAILSIYDQAFHERHEYVLQVQSDFIDRLRALHPVEEPQMVFPLRAKKTSRKFWIAAASVAMILGLAGYYVLFLNKKMPDQPNLLALHDVAAPRTNRATITLANGQKIFLDSAVNGILAAQGSIQIKKSGDGIISYNGNEQPKSVIEYNTLFNPRGSKVIDITLSDGTQVWLNAESSLKYPVAFAGNERQVEITGEAYFEVAHDKSKPFRVKKDKTEIEVLGTHFNVNAYSDENDIKVTLLEGSVRLLIDNQKQSKILKPGEQAIVKQNIEIKNDVDLKQVMAWKNGLFQFHDADLPTVLRQLSRWYDVDVKYEGGVPEREFEGKMQRDLTLGQALKLLEKNQVHFNIEGNRIMVKP